MNSTMKKLAASLVSAFALATGAGPAATAEPAKEAKTVISPASISNFNDHSKAVVLQRNLGRNIRDEPILIKQDGGRYLVHESTAFGAITGDGVGHLQSYSKEGLVKQHGPVENIRTYEQYKADSKVLSSTPGLGPKLADAAFDMPIRLRDLEGDMKMTGETFVPSSPKIKRAP